MEVSELAPAAEAWAEGRKGLADAILTQMARQPLWHLRGLKPHPKGRLAIA